MEELDHSTLKITEHLSYVCRKARGRIQNRVAWQANSLEVTRMESLALEVLGPPGSEQEEEVLGTATMRHLKPTRDEDGSLTYEYLLIPQHQELDGLIVKFDAAYLSPKDAFYTWRMIDPSENVQLTILYPADMKIQFKPFLLEPKPKDAFHDSGVFTIVFDSWIMPRSGFAWKLVPREIPTQVESAETREQQQMLSQSRPLQAEPEPIAAQPA